MGSQTSNLWSALDTFRLRVLDQMQGGIASLGVDLSLPQSIALTQIAARQPITISALRLRLQRSQATTSHLVSQLELRGLVERSEDPGDGRRTQVRLSKHGQRLISKLEQLRKQSFEHVLSCVPTVIQKELEDALWATIAALKDTSS